MSDDPATSAAICGIGMITAIGGNALQTLASFRAGISRYAESPVYNKRFNPMTMALVPEDVLPPLNDEVAQQKGLTARQMRMLRLATPALQEATQPLEKPEPVPLFLAVPESMKGRALAVQDNFIALLATQTEVALDPAVSKLFRTGRAAGLQALDEAIKLLNSGTHDYVLVGGVDTYLDLYLLATLDQDDRVLADGVMDGFAPGEGAGFLLLALPAAAGGRAIATLHKPGLADEAGYRYSTQPYQGDGLTDAIRDAINGNQNGPIQTVLGSINGENFGAKEWGVAASRNQADLAGNVRFEHPADCFGDIGAAAGPILMGLAALGLRAATLRGPALVWCSSEGRQRAATRVTLQ